VQLIDADSGFQLWAHRYDHTGTDILGIQDRIAESVAHALQATFSRNDRVPGEDRSSADLSAYECYRRGRKYYDEFSPQAVEFAIEMFVRAIGLDPHYAAAYAGLADCWSYTYLYNRRSEAVLEQADWASLKAHEMDAQSAQSHASRGLWLSLSGRNDEADRAFETAIKLDPDLFEAHYFRARHCFVLGRPEDAAEAYENAFRVRPDDYQSPLLLAQIEDRLGRHDRAKAVRKQGCAIAERHLKWQPGDARALYLAANGLAALGEHSRSRRMAERACAIRGDDPMLLYNVGCVFSLLGLAGPALECLENAVHFGFTQKAWFEHDSDLDSLRTLTRFRDLLRGMN
jgi:adenylate cyclase